MTPGIKRIARSDLTATERSFTRALKKVLGYPCPLSRLTIDNWHPCVYALLKRGQIVYVGKSCRLLARLGLHYHKWGGKFDQVIFCPVDLSGLDAAERALIECFRPPLNITFTRCRVPRPPVELDVPAICANFKDEWDSFPPLRRSAQRLRQPKFSPPLAARDAQGVGA